MANNYTGFSGQSECWEEGRVARQRMSKTCRTTGKCHDSCGNMWMNRNESSQKSEWDKAKLSAELS